MKKNLNEYSAYEIKRYLEATAKLQASDNEVLQKIIKENNKEEQDESFVNWDEYI